MSAYNNRINFNGAGMSSKPSSSNPNSNSNLNSESQLPNQPQNHNHGGHQNGYSRPQGNFQQGHNYSQGYHPYGGNGGNRGAYGRGQDLGYGSGRYNNNNNNYGRGGRDNRGYNNRDRGMGMNAQDDANICAFYSKTGACRHGTHCSKRHIKPEKSRVICLVQMYDNPKHIRGLTKKHSKNDREQRDEKHEKEINAESGTKTEENEIQVENEEEKEESKKEAVKEDDEQKVIDEEKSMDKPEDKSEETVPEKNVEDEKDETEDNRQVINDIAIFENELTLDESEIQKTVDSFYKDVFMEISINYGKIQDLVICENVNNHLSGNVYIKFYNYDDANTALEAVNDMWYNGRPVFGELSAASRLEDAICNSYSNGDCDRGGLCNFMHIRPPSGTIKEDLMKSQEKYYLNKKANQSVN